jgi:hypothetical protein
MKKCLLIGLMTACLLQAAAEPPPLPVVTAQALDLPFGLKWFMGMDAVKKMTVDYGPADCQDQSCHWMKSVEAGTVMLGLQFHAQALVGVDLDYTIRRDFEAHYLPLLETLKQSTREWEVRDLREFPMLVTTPWDEYSAENRDSRMIVKWREGEHSLFIHIEMRAK